MENFAAGIYLNGATDIRTDNFGNIGLPIYMALKLFPLVQEKLQAGNFIVEIAVTVFTILCCLVAEKLISRFLPQIFGIDSLFYDIEK